ncbi:MAG: CPBP family intramembrane metalloprotease [Kouleothrix sp.]|nr:CPBP family intramembrane metalloprotease [Kouleothrix sp.]
MATIPLASPAAPARSLRASIAQHPLLAYFIIAFAPVWLALLPFVLARNGLGLLPLTLPDVAFIVAFIGSTLLGPTAGAFVVTAAAEGRPGVRRLLGRYVQWRVGLRWYAIALFGYIVLQLLGAVIWSGAAPALDLLARWPLIFTSYLPLVLAMVLFPALAEEPGWRGFALPRLQARYGPLAGTLILGFLHGIWHLPVYMLVSSPAAMGPFNVVAFISNTIAIVALTVVWTWVFNNAKGSILMAILLHAASNATGNFFGKAVPNLPPQHALTTYIIYIAAAVLLVAATRGRLGYSEPAGSAPDVSYSSGQSAGASRQ